MPNIITLADVKTRLNITTAGDDARITLLLPSVDAYIVRETKLQIFTSTDELQYYDGRDSRALVMRDGPITTISEVHSTTDVPRVYDSSTLVASDDYIHETVSDVLYRVDGRLWPRGANTVRLKVDRGWATVPEELQDAALQIIAAKLAKGKGSLYHIASERLGDGQTTIRNNDVPADARRIIASYAATDDV